mmetsp:Transcript_40680/g.46411  ORF Transcript_40680/g.46411 Transcript_40680/m.46411 type:complete len:510 (-) Transcript_40680:224-1753(-)
MKLTASLISLIATGGMIASTTTVVDANMSIRGNTKSANKLMTFSRRLDQNQYNGGYGNNNNQNQYANNYQGGYGNNYNNGQNNGGGGYGGGYGNNQGGGDDEESLYFLNNYSIKLLSCIQGERVVNYEDGESEPSTVVFRLCPSNSCTMNSALGCESGYGDYAVGINTFMEAYRESQEDNNNQYSNSMLVYNAHGQAFDASEYMECSEYNMDENNNQEQNYYQYNNYNNNGQNNNNNNQNQNHNQNQQYNNNNYQGGGQQNGNYNYYQDMDIFIGPACSADGTTIGLSMFMEDTCSYAAGDDMDFANVAYGWDSLPFADGGLISDLNCLACYGPDADYNYELREICTDTYAASTSRCEANMTSHSYYGQNTNGCDYVESLIEAVYGSSGPYTGLFATTSLSGSLMDILGQGGRRRMLIACLVLLGLAVVSYGYYYFNKKKRAQAAATGKLLDEEEEYEPPVAVTDEEGIPVVQRRSAVMALVQGGVDCISVGVARVKGGVQNAIVWLYK